MPVYSQISVDLQIGKGLLTTVHERFLPEVWWNHKGHNQYCIEGRSCVVKLYHLSQHVSVKTLMESVQCFAVIIIFSR